MARKDNLTNAYMRNPRIYADFMNNYIYDGKDVIKWEYLEEIDTTNIAVIPGTKGKKSVTTKRTRDIIKKSIIMRNDKVIYALLGIENQTDIHYAMPVRNMLYDAMGYLNQVEIIEEYNRSNGNLDSKEFISGISKLDRLTPIITVTLYWGAEKWDAATTLRDMLEEVDEDTDKFINDYDINLVSIIDEDDFSGYKTELGQLFKILSVRNDKQLMLSIVDGDDKYKNIDRKTAEIMREFSDIKLPKANEKGEYDMCKAVMELRQEGYDAGVKDGEKRGKNSKAVEMIKNLMLNSQESFDNACDMLGVNEKDKKEYSKMI